MQVGIKLLAADVSIAWRLAGKVAHGKTLTRHGTLRRAARCMWSQSECA